MKNEEKTNIVDITNRFNTAIAVLKGKQLIKTQKDISDRGLIAKTNLSRAIKGDERYLTHKFLEKFASEFNFNYEWLLTGTGEMLNDSEEETIGKQYSIRDEELILVRERLSLYEEKIDFYKEKIEQLEEENERLKKVQKPDLPGERVSTAK